MTPWQDGFAAAMIADGGEQQMRPAAEPRSNGRTRGGALGRSPDVSGRG
jgi:hypothetical protein